MTQLILVEDDERMGGLLKRFLQGQGYSVVWEKNGPEGLRGIQNLSPDLVILDLMLPGFSGLEICRRARPNYTGPILMLTACDDDISEISALDLGIDDYLTKPFRTRVLAARIRALLRRATEIRETGSGAPTSVDLMIGPWRFVIGKRQVFLGEEPLPCTESEFELLWFLARHAGTVIHRDEIYTALKGSRYRGFDRAIDMRISALRKKLNDSQPPYRYIKTIRGKGYLFSSD